MSVMQIWVRHPAASNDYDRATLVDVGEDAIAEYGYHHPGYTYLDTPYGSFKRAVAYVWFSPYGWEAVSWG